MKLYHQLRCFALPYLQGRRKKRAKNFLLLSFTLLLKRTCCLAHLARTLPKPEDVQAKVNRFWRFLDNDFAISPQPFFSQMGLWVLPLFEHRKRFVLILGSTFFKSWFVLSFILPYLGRGLILQMAVYDIKNLPKSKPELERDFLKALFSWLPLEKRRFVLVADRGFSSLKSLRWLKKGDGV